MAEQNDHIINSLAARGTDDALTPHRHTVLFTRAGGPVRSGRPTGCRHQTILERLGVAAQGVDTGQISDWRAHTTWTITRGSRQ